MALGQVVLQANGRDNERRTRTQRQKTSEFPSTRLHSRMVPLLATMLTVPRGSPKVFPNFMSCLICRDDIPPLGRLQQNKPVSHWINPHPRLWDKARSPQTCGSCQNHSSCVLRRPSIQPKKKRLALKPAQRKSRHNSRHTDPHVAGVGAKLGRIALRIHLKPPLLPHVPPQQPNRARDGNSTETGRTEVL